jgi:transcriptional regulator with XRE-family HTH domain
MNFIQTLDDYQPPNEPTMELGRKIKALRIQQQLTLEQLAQKSGLSTGVLSQVERDLSKPRVTTLQKISKALNISLSSLFSDNGLSTNGELNTETQKPDSGFVAVVRKEQRKKVLMPWGTTMEMLCPDLRHKIEFMYLVYPPGTKVDEIYSHQGEECGLVLEGTFKGVVGGQEITLEEGDSVYYDSSLPHRWENIGDKIVRAIWVITPPWL